MVTTGRRPLGGAPPAVSDRLHAEDTGAVRRQPLQGAELLFRALLLSMAVRLFAMCVITLPAALRDMLP